MSAEYSSLLKINLSTFHQRVLGRLGVDPDLLELSTLQREKVQSVVQSAFSGMHDTILVSNIFTTYKKSVVSALGAQDIGIAERIGDIFDEEFGKTKQINQESISTFRHLYEDFLCQRVGMRIDYAQEAHERWFVKKLFDWSDVDLHCSIQQIQDSYRQFKVLQVRPIDPDATTLMIGCGNGRFSDEGNEPLDVDAFVDEYENPFEYSLRHNHPLSVVTVDLDLSSDPTIIAPFGLYPIAGVFRGKKFDEIILEGTVGYYPLGQDGISTIGVEDARSLLAPGGKLYFRNEDEQADWTDLLTDEETEVSAPSQPSTGKRKATHQPVVSDDEDEKEPSPAIMASVWKKPKAADDSLSDPS
jgi:hypothetical protein